MIRVTDSVHINEAALTFTAVLASGPGGQNVNKVSTAIQLRFALWGVNLRADARSRLRKLAGSRLTQGDEIIFTAQRFRTQSANRQDALDRLIDMIAEASVQPRHRRPTRPSRAARSRRMDSKTRDGTTKQLRGKVRADD